MRALSVEDKAEKRKVKKERQRTARAQAAAREGPSPAAGSSAVRQSPSSVQRSSPVSIELLPAERKPSSIAQTGIPAVEAVLQAAGRLLSEPAEALHKPASEEGRKRRKGKGKFNRSGAPSPGNVHSGPAAGSRDVPGTNSMAAMPGPQTAIAQAADESVSAHSSPAEHPESSPSALHGSSSAQRLHSPVHKEAIAAYRPQYGGSSMPSPGQHTDRGAQALSPAPVAQEEESWQEVRSGRRKPTAKVTAARIGKDRSGGQTLPETQPKPTAAVPMTPQQAQRLQLPSGTAARPELPKSGPTQADIAEAPQSPAVHASSQRQPAQPQLRAAPAAMQSWPQLQASAGPEPERIPDVPEPAAVGAPQQVLDHKALLTDLLQQPRARSSSTTKQQTVSPLKKSFPTGRLHFNYANVPRDHSALADAPGSRLPACGPDRGASIHQAWHQDMQT